MIHWTVFPAYRTKICLAHRGGDAISYTSKGAQYNCPAARFHGAFPALTTDILGLVNRLLPKSDNTASPAEPGVAVQKRTPEAVQRVIQWGEGDVPAAQHQPNPLGGDAG